MKSIVIIDDQISYAEAFGLALSTTDDLRVAGRAPDATSGIDLCRTLAPDLVVSDYRLPGENGIDVAKALRTNGITTPVMILTGFAAPSVSTDAAAVEDAWVFSKDVSINQLVDGMRKILAGEVSTASRCAESTAASDLNVPGLSPGELEVLQMLAEGNGAAEIANMLHLSLHTIRSRIKHALRKLEVNSQIEAIATATRLGLVVPPS